MRLSHFSRQFLVSATMGFLAVPLLTTAALIRSQDDEGVLSESVQDIEKRAIGSRTSLRRQERSYWRATDVYRELLRQGITGLIAPDINDPRTIDPYLEGKVVRLEDLEGLREALDDASLKIIEEYNDYPEWRRDLLDGYLQMGFCPQSLQRLFRGEGFYEFCLKYVTARSSQRLRSVKRQSAIRGYSSLQRFSPYSLRERLQRLGDSLKGGALRPEGLTKPSTRYSPELVPESLKDSPVRNAE